MKEYHAKFETENYYHIFNRGNNRETIFKSDRNYQYFLNKWKKYIHPHAETFAFCLMPNHFHFLIRIKSLEEVTLIKPQRLDKGKSGKEVDINPILEEQFKRLFMSYALAFNKEQDRTGSLFQKRFKRIHVASNGYLTTLIQYIHNNPVHHGFAKSYSGWKYSSYNSLLSNQTTLIERDEVINWFVDKRAFEEFHEQNKLEGKFEHLEY